MIIRLFKWVILSLTLIILVHYLYIYLIETLTVPKVKDLINKPIQQYEDILNKEIKNNEKQEI